MATALVSNLSLVSFAGDNECLWTRLFRLFANVSCRLLMFVNVTDARRIIRPIRRDCFAVCRCFLSFVNVCFTSKRQIRVSRRDCFVVCRCFLLTFVNVCFAQISFCSNLPFSFTRTMLDTTTCLSMFDKYTAFVLAKRIVNLRYDKKPLTHFIKGDVSFASSIETFQRKDNNRCNFRSHP